MSSLWSLILPLYCVVISLLCIFGGGVALIFTLGATPYGIAALVIVLFEMANLLLTMGAFAPAGRRIVRISAISCIAGGMAIAAASFAGGSTGDSLAAMLIWCAALYLNWQAIRTLADMHLASR